MQVTRLLWKDHQNNTRTNVDPTIIFTTEDPSIIQEYNTYNSTLGDPFLHPLHFVTNHRDIILGTGNYKRLARNKNFKADESTVSTLTSLKLQMMSRVTSGNCCSNFHQLLGDFLEEGAGATHENTFVCLQEMADPEYKLCCMWDGRRCRADRAKVLQNRSRATTGSV
jgi:hypothetical protein